MEDSGIDSDPKNPIINVSSSQFQGNSSDSSSGSNNLPAEFVKTGHNNTRQLQKKLEQKIQEAKKLQRNSQQQDGKRGGTPGVGPNLIPIQRLSIPSKSGATVSKENFPLVDWESEDSDEDIHFFPVKNPVKQELTDTFSIEEYQISPDEDDLNLLPPLPTYKRFTLCCFSVQSKCSIL